MVRAALNGSAARHRKRLYVSTAARVASLRHGRSSRFKQNVAYEGELARDIPRDAVASTL
jgi:hypothetical protein